MSKPKYNPRFLPPHPRKGRCLDCHDEWWEDKYGDAPTIVVCPECGSLAVKDIT